jgi:thermostable 8-oxoguanine DNA glycosylase
MYDNEPLTKNEQAMNEVAQMLKEEGITFDKERGEYIDENGNVLDLDIQKIIEEYIEHMDKAYNLL